MVSVIEIGTIVKTLIAYVIYPFVGARNVGHLLGIVPYFPFFSRNVTRESFTPPIRFMDFPLDHRPATYWDRPTPSKVTRHHILKILNGQANRSGAVFDCNGNPITEACHPLKQRWKYRWRNLRNGLCVDYMKDQAQPYEYEGRIGVLTSSNQHIYSHWLLDILPRIAKLQEQNNRVDFYYLQHTHPFQIETIKKLNLCHTDHIINCAEIPWVSGDELVVPCHQIMFGYHHPRWACRWLREKFLPAGDMPVKPWRKIFISRAFAN
ncbi:MAG: hypothetical protein ACPGYT_14245, partial [Nitrospirales bacterium]